jgi:hypothetical protein
MILIRTVKYFVIFLVGAVVLSACSYSFTGASLPAHIKTINIQPFNDNSGSGEPYLSDDITNQLITLFVDDGNLTIAGADKADSKLSGTITQFSDRAETITGENITARKITIRVKAVYMDLVKRKKIFEKTFTAFSNYNNNSGDVTDARNTAIKEALDQIAEDVLIGVIAQW